MKALGPRRRPIAWAIFLIVQTLATVFFVGDALADYLAGQLSPHLMFEMLVALALALGMAFGVMVLRQTLEEMRAQDVALASARGALGDVIAAQFTAWGLTPAERDVGFLALKGLDVAEIAEMRGAAAGTVRARASGGRAKAKAINRP